MEERQHSSCNKDVVLLDEMSGESNETINKVEALATIRKKDTKSTRFGRAIDDLLTRPVGMQNIRLIQGYLSLQRIEDDNSNRKEFADWVKTFMWWYMGFVGLFMLSVYIILPVADAFTDRELKVEISDSIIITMLSTTTANIIGMVIIVLKGYFNTKDYKIDDMEEGGTPE